jgi:hypothetical protein
MQGINVLISMIFLLIIIFIGLIRAQTLLGVFACFVMLTLVAYITIYLFKAN